MAKYWTYAEIKTKIENDMDLEAEDFVQPSELLNLVNEAIDEAEADIHTLGLEDNYFLTVAELDITAGENYLDLPSEIYASKIKAVIYNNGTEIYPVKRFRGPNMFLEIERADYYTNSTAPYRYILLNQSGDSVYAARMKFSPAFRDTLTGAIKIYHLRNVARMVDDTSVLEIPEFVHFIIKHVKYQVYKKEIHPNTQLAKGELEEERKRMIETLMSMVPDQDSQIPMDLSAYDEST